MAFWDFFRRKAKKKEEVTESERITPDEFESWISNKKVEIKQQESVFLVPVKDRISLFIKELEQGIAVLKQIDLNEKKVEEKIILIVKQNLDNYISSLEILIVKLNNFLGQNEGIIDDLKSIFSDFEKRFRMNYQKSTFLVGKEIVQVRDSIGTFLRDIDKIVKENQSLMDKLRIISELDEKIRNFSKIKQVKVEIEQIIPKYEGQINTLREKIKNKDEKIKDLKKSDEFIKHEKKKEELTEKIKKINTDIANLRQLIDFKSLANFFHKYEDSMAIIKDYRENFRQAFEKAEGKEIISLIKEAKLNDVEIIKKAEEITKAKQEAGGIVIGKSEVDFLTTEIEKLEEQLTSLNSKKDIGRKKYEKHERNLNEIISSVKEELMKINVEVC